MITWIISAWSNPLVRKIVAYGAIGILVFLFLRWYGNRQYYAGEKAGRLYEARAIEKAKQKEWAAKESAIATATQAVNVEKRAVEAAAAQLRQNRADLSRALNGSLTAINKERIQGYANAAAVPDNRIWNDIRAISRQLSADTR